VEDGFVDTSKKWFKVVKSLSTFEKCLDMPGTQEKPSMHVICSVDKKVKLDVPNCNSIYIYIYIYIYQQETNSKVAR
jgi:hypothetical protein